MICLVVLFVALLQLIFVGVTAVFGAFLAALSSSKSLVVFRSVCLSVGTTPFA